MKKKRVPWVFLVILWVFGFVLLAVDNLEEDRQMQDIRRLEQALHRSAVACYAVEGAYPSDVAYLREHYGLTYDERRYTVHYELVASNFMPTIEVMVRTNES